MTAKMKNKESIPEMAGLGVVEKKETEEYCSGFRPRFI